MDAFVDLVITGAKKLVELIPLWLKSSEEEREALYQRTKARVEGLDAEFDAADKRDEAATKKAQDAIDAAEKTQP